MIKAALSSNSSAMKEASSAMDVQGIKKKIQELPKTAKFSKQWVAEQVLLLVEKDEPPAAFLELILDKSTASVSAYACFERFPANATLDHRATR